MENFTYLNPTKVDFGAGKEALIGQHLADHGMKKVLLCYGSERIKRDGLFDLVSKKLTSSGVDFVEFGGISSNPVLSKIREAVACARENEVDAVLSVGGGSVLDSAKAIAAGVSHQGDVWDLFTGKAEILSALPVFAILTLAATGSEMNTYAVVTNEESKEKLFIASAQSFPKVSIVNPELMRGVSSDYLVYSAADIISHVIEPYFTAAVQPKLLSRLAESVIKTVMETTEILLENPADISARGEFAWAATLAQNGLVFTGASGFSYPNHAIEHALSALYNVPHGAGLSVVMPAWMKWYHSHNPGQFERFSQTVFGLETAQEGIAALENWFNQIGTPTRLSQLGLGESELSAVLENAMGNIRMFGMADIYTSDDVEKILRSAL